MKSSLYAIITTIQEPTACVRGLAGRIQSAGGALLIVGDEKGPWRYDAPPARLIDLHQQRQLGYRLSASLPTRHYARKNIGYLEAIREGAACLYETDDDNAPNAVWRPRELECEALPILLADPARPIAWLNVYRMFSDRLIWPRGFPLDSIRDRTTYEVPLPAKAARVSAPIQQGLADRSPDVDAIWRLVLDDDFSFRPGPSLWIGPGTWCPFNSQTTWWWPAAYPLLYLPSFCSFRMTDIWRSFIAQRCLWAMDCGLVFHAPEVFQDRNPHNLMRDFEAEVPGYNGNTRIAGLLSGLDLPKGGDSASSNLLRCYELLIQEGFFPADELRLVQDWFADLATAAGR